MLGQRSNSVFLKSCWLHECLHPPVSSTCLWWLEKLTLSCILAERSFPFSLTWSWEHGRWQSFCLRLFHSLWDYVFVQKSTYGQLWFSSLSVHQSLLEGLTKQISGLYAQAFWFKWSQVGPRICFSKNTSIILMCLFRIAHFENHCSRRKKPILAVLLELESYVFNQLISSFMPLRSLDI